MKSESIIGAADSMPGRYEPHSADYENDDDGFREGEGALIPGAGLRTTHPQAVAWLQTHCSRRHVPRAQPRVCSLCLAEIPAKD